MKFAILLVSLVNYTTETSHVLGFLRCSLVAVVLNGDPW